MNEKQRWKLNSFLFGATAVLNVIATFTKDQPVNLLIALVFGLGSWRAYRKWEEYED